MPKFVFLRNIISGRLLRGLQKMMRLAPGTCDLPVTGISADPTTALKKQHQSLISDELPLLSLTSNPSGMPVSGVERSLVDGYLTAQGNSATDIAKFHQVLQYAHIILEIGCGSCEVALQIAAQNPNVGIIATDLYECPDTPDPSSHYHQVARAWKERYLAVQQLPLHNLVVLKAEIELLRHLPDQTVDSVLIINPEPKVGKLLLDILYQDSLHTRIKPGPKQIVILPYCREMGIYTCGGYEFEHDEDWSLGLGFMMASGFQFWKTDRIHWGVDLYRSSPYWRNSTQMDVYIFGDTPP